MSVSVTDVTSTEYLVVDNDTRRLVLTPFGEAERGLAFSESRAINKWRKGEHQTHVEVRITHTRTEQYAVKE